MSAHRLLLPKALLLAAVLALGSSPAHAVCLDFGGFAIFQCADLGYFAPIPDPTFQPASDRNGLVTNVRGVFWQIGFGSRHSGTGLGTIGDGVSGGGLFTGNDSGGFGLELVDARTATGRWSVPLGAVCLRNNNWGNAGVDGCCDNVRDPSQTFGDDGLLNPYFDAGRAIGYGELGYYSLAWQQDYPMAVLLTANGDSWLAVAAVASLDRGNHSSENGPCAATPGSNPTPCDFQVGSYNFREVADGVENQASGEPNVVPWQRTPVPVPSVITLVDPNDPAGDRVVDLEWRAVHVYSDLSVRPSTNPALAPQDPTRAFGVGVADVAAAFGGLVRYVLEISTATDAAFDAPSARITTRDTSLTGVLLPAGSCLRLRTVFGKEPETSVITRASCRRGMCGDVGYEVSSPRLCLGRDEDGDGVEDSADNCPSVANPSQADSDSDGAGDACDSCNDPDADGACQPNDNCPALYNPSQTDIDHDGVGDACDPCIDVDHDGFCTPGDNCPTTYNPSQLDWDGDGIGDECESCIDPDHDGACSPGDNCPTIYNPSQQDADGDGFGDACDNNLCVDSDDDGICDSDDNCWYTYNPRQLDKDGDGVGDACWPCFDHDEDGACYRQDNCPYIYNPSQADQDADTLGNVCDDCPSAYNPAQRDMDHDHAGDACDLCPSTYNPGQAPVSGCDPCADVDGDGLCAAQDDCPSKYNPFQEDADRDATGDLCDNCPLIYDPQQTCFVLVPAFDDDPDHDRYPDLWPLDNCPGVFNPGQEDRDGDVRGDGCDNCPDAYNILQTDTDRDGVGDACEACNDPDLDGACAPADNCPSLYNPGQGDADEDGTGDLCDLDAPLSVDWPADGVSLDRDRPPAIFWSTGGFDRFRVYVSWRPDLFPGARVESDVPIFDTASWTVPENRWRKVCREAVDGALYVAVEGENHLTKERALSPVRRVRIPHVSDR